MITVAETQQIARTCKAEILPPKDARDTSVRKASLRGGDVYINGRFLSQRGSGVQRFARQLVLALDAELAQSSENSERRWSLLVPPGLAQLPTLNHIEVRVVGTAKGHLWDQLLRFYCRSNDILVNLANSGPVFRSRSISILHDAAVFRTPQNFTLAYRLFHQWLGRLIAIRSTIGTVSEFSRGELTAALGINAARIFVVPNSCEHLRDVIPDPTVLERLNLKPGRYFVAIGSPVTNKNLAAAIAAFTRLDAPGQQFVVVGAVDTAVFGQGLTEVPPGVVLAGAIPDAQVNALLKNATALVFPSLYEGFGIPPLEAMLNRCPVIASNIPPVVEVCGDAVLYFDPTDVSSITRALRRTLDEPELLPGLVTRGEARAAMYSWQRSALRLMEAVARLT
jgi:glycosyltransferase involved in cell wall biosynthesis